MRQQATVGAQHAAPSRLPPHASRLLSSARIAHLATAAAKGQPHVIPICFFFDGKNFFSPIDEKPKSTVQLKRLRNIEENPSVSLVIDHYEENWNKLAYVLVFGKARILSRGNAHRRAVRLLRRKYPQYRGMTIQARPLIVIKPRRVVLWSADRQ
jgi:PPOX class probable F420-dependent enzyme